MEMKECRAHCGLMLSSAALCSAHWLDFPGILRSPAPRPGLHTAQRGGSKYFGFSADGPTGHTACVCPPWDLSVPGHWHTTQGLGN